jgi:hypothetical protein
MGFISAIIVVILSTISTGVMIYVATASPIGPWMEPTMVLCALMLFRFIGRSSGKTNSLVCSVAGGSIGGILATAIGSSFPTLFFLDNDKTLFNDWMAHPIFFIFVVGMLSLTAALLGFCIADSIEDELIGNQKLTFPIGELSYRMIAARNQIKKAWELITGVVLTIIFCALQKGVMGMRPLIPSSINLIASRIITLGRISLHTPAIPLDFSPSYWAIGFVTGHVIAVPLLFGVVSRMVVLDPINKIFFPEITEFLFSLSFCSGMVLVGAITGFLNAPKGFLNAARALHGKTFNSTQKFSELKKTNHARLVFVSIVLFLIIAFLTYFQFPVLCQIFLIVATTICTYEICAIAGKIGLAQLGRFATFVMVPAMFLFKLTSVHITFIATFVEVCCGVAVDVLFGRKMARMADTPRNAVRKAQLLGIVVSSIVVGIIFWLLIKRFSLGSCELFAQRSQSRALLVQAGSFNMYILLIGSIFGYMLKYIRMNPMMVLGGLLMPLNVSLGLIIGGFAALCTKNKEEWYPLWSGVFAAHSLWMVYQALW